MSTECDACGAASDGVGDPLIHSPDCPYVELAALYAQVEDLKKDAARYRWLRDQLWQQALSTVYALPVVWGVDYPGEAGKSMDAAIDSAINKESQS